MELANKFGIAFTIGIVIVAVSFAVSGGSITTSEIENVPDVVETTIEETEKQVPELFEETIDKAEETIEKTVPPVPEPVEEAIEEIEEKVPEPATVVEQAQGEHIEYVSIPEGTSVPGCEADNSCYIPYTVELTEYGEVFWTNDDTVAHTVTSGTPEDGPTVYFDSGLMAPGDTYTKKFSFIEGEIDYFCLVHPWMQGKVIIK